MTVREELIHEIENAPDFLLEKVLDFLLFIKTRWQHAVNVADTAQVPPQSPKPIWEAFEEFADSLPEAVTATLPTDGAAQVDHYLYGFPKRDA